MGYCKKTLSIEEVIIIADYMWKKNYVFWNMLNNKLPNKNNEFISKVGHHLQLIGFKIYFTNIAAYFGLCSNY